MELRNKKTGEIGELYYMVATENPADIAIYRSLNELSDDWKDYKPAEPLIKDEKIRKAVRAWAEANELDEVYLSSNGYEIYGGINDTVMQFTSEPFPFADKKETFTIAELCGEKEE